MKTTAITLVLAVCASACEEKPAPPTAKESTPPSASAMASAMTAPKAFDPKTSKDTPATSMNTEAVKAYRMGVDYALNVRPDDALTQFKKAVSLDPKFTTAQAAVGMETPGVEGDKMIAAALASAGTLPEAEKLYIEMLAARHAGDRGKAAELGKKFADMLPMSWEAQYMAADTQGDLGKPADAKAYDNKAIALDATAAPPHNHLGYIALFAGKNDEAVAELKKYVELRPKEPNPQDSYGEALLASGKFDESEAAFKKALEIEPTFVVANTGVGFANLYKGDYAKATEAFNKAKDSTTLSMGEKSGAYLGIAWGQVAQNKLPDALKTLDAWDADAQKAKDVGGQMRALFNRAEMTMESGKPADALKMVPGIMEKIEKAEASDARKMHWKVFVHSFEAIANARLGKKDEAEKARAAVVETVGKNEDLELKANVALATGAAAMAKGDAAAAVTAYKTCESTEIFCAWERMKAEEKAGQKDAAAASKTAIQALHPREGIAFYVWSKNAPAPAKK